MATYLITGGCGFIGSALCRELVGAGHSVRVLDDLSNGDAAVLPPQCELSVGDVNDRAVLDPAIDGVDGCFHLAAVTSVTASVEDWPATSRTNLGGTVSVLDAAARVGRTPVPVVYASSAAVYGDAGPTARSEDMPTAPITPYGVDKLASEAHARVAAELFRVRTIGMRFFNVYGPGQSAQSQYAGVISIFVDRALAGQPLPLHGDGGQSRDFVHVDDAVRFLLAAMNDPSGRSGVFNVCTGQATTIAQLAEMICRQAGREAEFERLDEPAGNIRYSLGAPELAARQLGQRTRIECEDGIGGLLRPRDAA